MSGYLCVCVLGAGLVHGWHALIGRTWMHAACMQGCKSFNALILTCVLHKGSACTPLWGAVHRESLGWRQAVANVLYSVYSGVTRFPPSLVCSYAHGHVCLLKAPLGPHHVLQRHARPLADAQGYG